MLVSCIMPTRGRREMAREAFECWKAQTWMHREIIIVDDIQCPSFDLSICREPGVRYIPLLGHQTIGAKRNIACETARGEAIAHWDSDDLYAPGRLEDQAKRLSESGAWITGYNEAVFIADDGTEYLWRNTILTPQGEKILNQHYALGSSMVYWRSAWWNNRFQPTSQGEDNTFQMEIQIENGGNRIYSVPSRGLMTVRMHGDCTSERGAAFLEKQERMT